LAFIVFFSYILPNTTCTYTPSHIHYTVVLVYVIVYTCLLSLYLVIEGHIDMFTMA